MLISVITINYNNVIGVTRTINSVITQTSQNYEFIIIDGGSDDGSVSVIEDNQRYVTYWVSERDKGIYHAMNKGVMAAHGDYCIFLNSGDIFCDNNVLNNIQEYLGRDDIVIGELIDSISGTVIFPAPQREISFYFLYSGSVTHQSSFIKTELLRKSPYDESLKIAGDWKFFLTSIIFQDCSVRFVTLKIAFFDTQGISSTHTAESWDERNSILEDVLPRRVLLDYNYMKKSECLTQTLTPYLRVNYKVDKMLYFLGTVILKVFGKKI